MMHFNCPKCGQLCESDITVIITKEHEKNEDLIPELLQDLKVICRLMGMNEHQIGVMSRAYEIQLKNRLK